jgi:hypothetical protein
MRIVIGVVIGALGVAYPLAGAETDYGMVSGQVLEAPWMSPVSHQPVFLLRKGSRGWERGQRRGYEQKTDGEGRFQFQGVHPGDYTLGYSSSEGQDNPGGVVPYEFEPLLLTVDAREQISNLRLIVNRPRVVDFEAVDGDGAPVKEVNFVVERTKSENQGMTFHFTSFPSKTGDNGQARLRLEEGITTGFDYFLRVVGGWKVDQLEVDGEDPLAGLKFPSELDMFPLKFDDGLRGRHQVHRVKFRLKKNPEIRGRVLGQGGWVAQDVQVTVRLNGTHIFGSFPIVDSSLVTRTDAEGRYAVQVAPDSSGNVEVSHPRYGAAIGAPFDLSDTSIQLEDIVLQPYVITRGIVVDEQQKPVSAGEVHIMQVYHSKDGWAATAWKVLPIDPKTGEFTIPEMMVGRTYHVAANVPGFLSSLTEVIEGKENSGTSLIRLQVKKPLSLRGQLLDEGGQPLGGKSLYLDITPSHLISPISMMDIPKAITDAEGRFVFENLHDANYDLRLGLVPNGMGERMAAGIRPGPDPITVRGKLPQQTENFQGPTQLRRTLISVLDFHTKQPIPNAVVKVEDGWLGQSMQEPGEEKSRAVLMDRATALHELTLQPQSLPMVRIEAEGYSPEIRDFYQPHSADPQRAEIIELKRLRNLSGRLVDSNGKPLGRLRIRLSVPRDKNELSHEPIRFVGEARSDDEGYFLFPELEIQSYQLEIIREDGGEIRRHRTDWRSLEPGETTAQWGDISVP